MNINNLFSRYRSLLKKASQIVLLGNEIIMPNLKTKLKQKSLIQFTLQSKYRCTTYSRGGLVEEHDQRVVDELQSDGQSLLLPPGESVCPCVRRLR